MTKNDNSESIVIPGMAIAVALLLLIGTIHEIGGYSGATETAKFNAYVSFALTFCASVGWIGEKAKRVKS
jgi:hypothetical protein